jgi:hypothetical protein
MPGLVAVNAGRSKSDTQGCAQTRSAASYQVGLSSQRRHWAKSFRMELLDMASEQEGLAPQMAPA